MTLTDAINILKNERPHCGRKIRYTEGDICEAFDMAIKALEQEPCDDCVRRQEVLDILEDEWNMFSDANDAMQESIDTIKALNPVTPQQKIGRWIPVSERLPEKTGIYLISIGDLVTAKSFDGHNFRTESEVRFIPDAWMPLPETYRVESGDK